MCLTLSKSFLLAIRAGVQRATQQLAGAAPDVGWVIQVLLS